MTSKTKDQEEGDAWPEFVPESVRQEWDKSMDEYEEHIYQQMVEMHGNKESPSDKRKSKDTHYVIHHHRRKK